MLVWSKLIGADAVSHLAEGSLPAWSADPTAVLTAPASASAMLPAAEGFSD
jgi:hypothetical protein